MSIKYISLVVLAVQNSALILTMRYSRTIPGPRYIPTTAVVISEVIKSILSLMVLLYTRWKARNEPSSQLPIPAVGSNGQKPGRNLVLECLDDILQVGAILPVMVPAILYTIQNNLQYLAATNLDAATFQVLYQGKILTTAFFAVLILRQKLTALKWGAILILTSGIVLISYPSDTPTGTSQKDESRFTGLIAVLAACLLSGYTGVFLEYILKKAKNSQSSGGSSQLWVRNVQLSAASVMIASMGAAFVDGRQIHQHGFFYGYNRVVGATILLQATGGLIVAIVITYADNILKGFATSLSLIGSTVVSAMIGDVVLTHRFALGGALVLAATNIYGLSATGKRTEVTAPDTPSEQEQGVTLHYLSEDSDGASSKTLVEKDLTVIESTELKT